MTKALLVATAIFISALLGGWMHRLLTQFNLSYLLDYPARLLRNSERKLNIKHRTQTELKFRGTLFTAIVLSAAFLIGWLFTLISGNSIFTLFLLTVLLPIGSSWQRISMMKKNLQIGNLPATRIQLQGTVFQHYAVMDAPSLARAAAEYLAIQFSEKILAPIFWFLLLGSAGLFSCVVVYLLHETLSVASNKSPSFAKSTSDAHFFFNYIPARLAVSLCIIASLFLPNGNWREVTGKISDAMLKTPPTHLTLLCTASLLNLTLGGRASGYYSDGLVGNGKINPSIADITRAQYLFAILCALLFVCLGLFT